MSTPTNKDLDARTLETIRAEHKQESLTLSRMTAEQIFEACKASEANLDWIFSIAREDEK